LGFRDQYSLAHPKAKLDNALNKQAPFGTGNQRNPLTYQVPGGKKMNRSRFIQLLIVAVATTIFGFCPSAANAQTSPSCNTDRNAIVGSWLVQLGNGNHILETFNADGSVTEAGQGDIVAPFKKNFPSFTPGHGSWTCDADGNWVSTILIIMYDVRNPYVYLGQFKSHQKFALSDTNNLSGSDRLEITTPDGAVVDGGSTGLSTGHRIVAEPF
jgi:hypothetical protein